MTGINDYLLVIIDPQKDFCHPAGNYAQRHTGIRQITEAKENIERLVKRFSGSIAIMQSDYHAGQFETGLSICIPGTEGHRLDIDSTGCSIFTKNEHSCFVSPTFAGYLRDNFIKKLMLCGFLAEYCVYKTALNALENGYTVVLLKDCIGTGDDVQERKATMLAALQKLGARVEESTCLDNL